ncbi:MAG: FkbM family methyltransferase [Bacteroidetes bacterium]|nr:FkbM family methyltransferase [Bacteroidota bacterium]
METRTKHFKQKFFVYRIFGEKNYTELKFLKIRMKVFFGVEYEATKFLKNVMREGEIFFDIGANLGQYAIKLSKLFSGGVKIYLFEPYRDNYLRLEKYFTDLINVRVENAAVSNFSGNSELNIPLLNGIKIDTQATINESSRKRDFDGYIRESVRVISIDRFVMDNRIPRVDFIKSDTEGDDTKVILGARETISTYSPVIMTEDNLIGESLDFLNKEGYTDYLATTDGYLVKMEDDVSMPYSAIRDVVIYLHKKSVNKYKIFIKQK